MKIISCKLSPTKMSSISIVDEGGGAVQTISTSMTDFEDKLFTLTKEHNIQKIYFAGPKGYTTGLKNILDKSIVTKFNNTVEIICI